MREVSNVLLASIQRIKAEAAREAETCWDEGAGMVVMRMFYK